MIQIFDYVLIGFVAILSIFAVMIGLEQMIKIVMGNYLLSSICLAASNSLDALVNRFALNKDAKGILSIPFSRFETFFSDGKTIIVLLLYVGLLFVLFKRSKLSIRLPEEDLTQKLLMVAMVPLTVISMILALQIAVLGMKIVDIQQLQTFALVFSKSGTFLYTFVIFTPLWMLLHGLITIGLTTTVGIRYRNE
jgi:hypothetical protein